MITTTVSTVSTVTAIATLGLTTVIGLAAAITLMVFLSTRELARTGNSGFSLRVAKFAGVGIVPLVIAFVVMVATELIKIL